MGSGKSTTSRQIVNEKNGILFSEDEWLATLYPTEITEFKDYLHYSKRLKPLLEKLIVGMLNTGANVVMDFPANTKVQRQWFKKLLDESGASYAFYYLEVDDERCLQQISKRRIEQPDRAAFDTKEMFLELKKYFEPPQVDEGFEIRDAPLVKTNFSR